MRRSLLSLLLGHWHHQQASRPHSCWDAVCTWPPAASSGAKTRTVLWVPAPLLLITDHRQQHYILDEMNMSSLKAVFPILRWVGSMAAYFYTTAAIRKENIPLYDYCQLLWMVYNYYRRELCQCDLLSIENENYCRPKRQLHGETDEKRSAFERMPQVTTCSCDVRVPWQWFIYLSQQVLIFIAYAWIQDTRSIYRSC